MKSTTIITLILLQTFAFGQVIQHFENLDTKWNVAETYPDADPDNPTFAATTTAVFGFQGDTLINGDNWRKIYVTSDSLFQNNLEFVGATRVENDQVLFRDTLDQLDTLYDFTLDVGDSVLYNIDGNNPEWLDIIQIDSIQINGEYYKRFHIEEPIMSAFDELDEVWIEGIGSIHGPLFPRYPRKFSEEMPDSMLLTCSFSSGHEVWNHPNYDECYVNIVLGLQSYKQSDFNVYPNPFESEIYVQSENNKIQEITIFNHLGKEIRNIKDYSINEVIDLRFLDSGVYFLRIKGDRGSTTKRIIKN